MQTIFGKYLETSGNSQSTAYELKIVKNNKPFAFSQVKEHQILGLKKAKKGLYHKIADAPIFSGQQTRFNARKPFDCIWLVARNAYVVIWFYKPREKKIFYLIDIDDFLRLKETWKRKSIKEEELSGFDFVHKILFNTRAL